MNTKNSIFRFLLHYGISTVLLLMMICIIYLLQIINIQNKSIADVFLNADQVTCTAYVVKNEKFKPSKRDRLFIDTSQKKQVPFKILNIEEEKGYIVLQLSPLFDTDLLDEILQGNSKFSGYIFIGNIKLWSLIFQKWDL